MKVHSFKGKAGRYAILAQDDRSLLPAEFGPWKEMGESEIRPEDPDRLGVPTAICLENLATHGRHFFQLKMSFE